MYLPGPQTLEALLSLTPTALAMALIASKLFSGSRNTASSRCAAARCSLPYCKIASTIDKRTNGLPRS